MTGREPNANQRYFLDLLLVAIAEHGLTPTVIAARMTYDAAPESLQAAVAAGILGAGSVILGTSELCGAVLVDARQRVDKGADPSEAVEAIAARDPRPRRQDAGLRPSYPPSGRPARRTDPGACRGEGRGRPSHRSRPALHAAVAAVWGRPLPMNVSMPIAACLLDLDFPAAMIKAIPILARTAGLLAHIAEEQHWPIGFLMASHGEAAISYEDGSG